jgi:hypothetical protein
MKAKSLQEDGRCVIAPAYGDKQTSVQNGRL